MAVKSPVKSRRAEYSESTRQALVASARKSFTKHGYAGTSIEDIVTAARVTRGAFYHHFNSKQEIFEGVVGAVNSRMLEQIDERVAGMNDTWSAAVAGIDTFLDVCLQSEYQRIVLQEAPIALGWRRCRELDEQQAYGGVRGMVVALMRAGLIHEGPVDVTARILFAAFGEAAFAIDQADDKKAARDHAHALLVRFLEGLRVRKRL